MTVERRSSVGREDAHTSGLYTKRQLAIVRGAGQFLTAFARAKLA